jgi:flagellar protein FliO/FliZ
MDLQHYFTFVAALVFVLALIVLLAWIAKRLGVSGNVASGGRNKRVSIVESVPVDAKRRLILVRRDGVEHLVLLGSDGDTVIEAGIRPSFAATVDAVRQETGEDGA